VNPSERSEPTRCPACGATSNGGHVSVPDHEYAVPYVATFAACADCRSSFQAPMPRGDALASYYPSEYHSFGREGILTRIRYDMRIKRLSALAPGDGALLDYGCGDGSFLVRAANRFPGRRFFGYEIASSREVKELAGGAVTLVRGGLADLLDVLPRCEVVTMNHVIEHLPEPLAVLEALRERLLPGGVVEGQTPAAASLEQRVFGPRWSGYHAPRHTVVFSRAGLRRVFERAGYRDIVIDAAFNPAAIAVSLASLLHAADAAGRVERRGAGWLFWLGLATALAPVDLLSRASGIVNFKARRAAA
jgi:SAM-dependent methyltransferase